MGFQKGNSASLGRAGLLGTAEMTTHGPAALLSGETMTNTELMNLKGSLEAKRLELVAQLRARVADLNIERGEPELIEWVQSMIDRDETAGMLNRFSSQLAQVERSLRSIDDGCYGTCAQCDRPIPLKRLQSIPWASYCVPCQEQFEAAESSSARYFDKLQAA